MVPPDSAPPLSLLLTLPQGALVATSLTVEQFGWHRSPGSAKFFHGRSVILELPQSDGKASFPFLPEGGWRDAASDTAAALRATTAGKKTKTALSNNALQVVPIDAPRRCFLMKTSGRALELAGPKELLRFENHVCDEALTPDEVAARIGRPPEPARSPRYYMVLAPIEMLVLSNLSPMEYAWYATHRPGKVFRNVAFAEVASPRREVIAEGVLRDAVEELTAHNKKTKTLVSGDLLNRIPFQDWAGFGAPDEGGLYLADRDRILVWRFPSPIPSQWSRAEG